MTVTFTPPQLPSYGGKKSSQAKILEAEFGDGYGQRGANGINNIDRKVQVKWDSLTVNEADIVEAFFEARGGHESFYYDFVREPGSNKKWICKTWDRAPSKPDYDSIEATFEMVNDL